MASNAQRARIQRLTGRANRETSRASATTSDKNAGLIAGNAGTKTVSFDTAATYQPGTYKVTASMMVTGTALDTIAFTLRAAGATIATPTESAKMAAAVTAVCVTLVDVITLTAPSTFGVQGVDDTNTPNVAAAGQATVIVEPLF